MDIDENNMPVPPVAYKLVERFSCYNVTNNTP